MANSSVVICPLTQVSNRSLPHNTLSVFLKKGGVRLHPSNPPGYGPWGLSKPIYKICKFHPINIGVRIFLLAKMLGFILTFVSYGALFGINNNYA